MVRVRDASARAAVQKLGGKRDLPSLRTWAIRYDGKKQLASVLAGLRDGGIPFSSGRQWPPCAVFEELREEGLLSGKYTKIFWHGPGKYETIER